ncbi:MAG: hypothetical protein QOI30_2402, partial [Mycobacterium sp.]|nr:hypothetical protein [Mycobacterium sp.]
MAVISRPARGRRPPGAPVQRGMVAPLPAIASIVVHKVTKPVAKDQILMSGLSAITHSRWADSAHLSDHLLSSAPCPTARREPRNL